MHTTGEKPGVGTYKCTNCGTTVTLDDPDDTLPPCPKCNNTEFEEICWLCEKSANISSAERRVRKDANFVECETCKKYYLDAPIMFIRDYEKMSKEERAMLSAYTRECFELGEMSPELGNTELLHGIITEYENKTPNEKLENLIWYIRKESPQFGDSVSLDKEKDYPITYSLSPEGFTEILNNSIEQKLVEPIESDFKLTEKGWKLGTELVKKKEK